jgi:ethanolamine utilization cobalamin adenosyltransferase
VNAHFTQDWRLLRGDLLEAVDRLASPQLALLVLGQEVRHEVVAEL